mmetsp:Transcript_27296/g.55191  ORF Transcript_27296/g.55191 Transcript_27296/m.55191 type:complete len:123 (+) Transcript_27296:218-586(+)
MRIIRQSIMTALNLATICICHRERSRQILFSLQRVPKQRVDLFTPICVIIQSACGMKEEVSSTFPSRQTHDYPTQSRCHHQYFNLQFIVSSAICRKRKRETRIPTIYHTVSSSIALLPTRQP